MRVSSHYRLFYSPPSVVALDPVPLSTAQGAASYFLVRFPRTVLRTYRTWFAPLGQIDHIQNMDLSVSQIRINTTFNDPSMILNHFRTSQYTSHSKNPFGNTDWMWQYGFLSWYNWNFVVRSFVVLEGLRAGWYWREGWGSDVMVHVLFGYWGWMSRFGWAREIASGI